VVTQSRYFQATVHRELSWYVVAVLKSFEHLCFDRTYDAEVSRFEFFVSSDMADEFIRVMEYFRDEHLVTDFQELPNRILVLGKQV
jgi:hypothetical protein